MNSFITWIGGKKLLRKNILEQFPDSTTYNRYIEVFGGAAWVLFGKDKIAKLETILDKGIMPSEKVLDFPVDCNTLTGSVNL